MAKTKTAVVVKKSPNAAVAVNSDKSIFSTILKILIIFFEGRCINKYFYIKFDFVQCLSSIVEKKRSHICETG